jgi:hypothetical protein
LYFARFRPQNAAEIFSKPRQQALVTGTAAFLARLLEQSKLRCARQHANLIKNHALDSA